MAELNDRQLEEINGGVDTPNTQDDLTYNPIYVTQTEQEAVSSRPVIEII